VTPAPRELPAEPRAKERAPLSSDESAEARLTRLARTYLDRMRKG
jgi:hypothetical protein